MSKKRENHSLLSARYKYKLNMLEPGGIMLKVAGVLILIAILLWLVGRHIASVVFAALAAADFIVLIILLVIEAHQDKVLNDIALRENKENDNL